MTPLSAGGSDRHAAGEEDPPLSGGGAAVYTSGIITEVPAFGGKNTFLIEAHPDLSSTSTDAGPFSSGDKYYVTVTNRTAIRLRGPDGQATAGSFDDVTKGMRAEVWFDGPILESYPAQGTAGRISILKSER